MLNSDLRFLISNADIKLLATASDAPQPHSRCTYGIYLKLLGDVQKTHHITLTFEVTGIQTHPRVLVNLPAGWGDDNTPSALYG